LEVYRQVLGEQHPDFATSLNNLAALYSATGRSEQAEPLYQQALEIRRQVLGEQHPDFATSLNNLAALYFATGRSEQAEPLYQQALEVLRQVLGPNHPHTKLVQANYDRARRAR
jgi:tetratricopeptide (TPR) repeat protein